MKPKYLIDECVSNHFPKNHFLYNHEDFFDSKHILGKGTKDEKILEYVKKTKMILITCDKKFSLKTACDQESVVFIDRMDGRAYKLIAEEDPDLKKFYDPVTYHLLNSQTVVRA